MEREGMMKPKMNVPDNAAMVFAMLHTIATELHLIGLSLSALCPDKDKETLRELIEKADAENAQVLKKIQDAMFPKERMKP